MSSKTTDDRKAKRAREKARGLRYAEKTQQELQTMRAMGIIAQQVAGYVPVPRKLTPQQLRRLFPDCWRQPDQDYALSDAQTRWDEFIAGMEARKMFVDKEKSARHRPDKIGAPRVGRTGRYARQEKMS